MKKIRSVLIAASVVAAALGMTGPAQATECTPKGCSTSCRVGDIRDANVDLDTFTVDLPQPIECNS